MDADDVAQIAESLRQALSADPAGARQAVDEFGWRELLGDEPQIAVSALFTLWGELLSAGSALDAVLLHDFPGNLPANTRVVLPPPGQHIPASRVTTDNRVSVDGIVQDGDGPLLVPCVDATSTLTFALCDAAPVIPGDPLDLAAGWRQVTATTISASPEGVINSGDADATATWQTMVSEGRRAIAYELVGISTAMLDMTVEHVRGREQFGRPLGSLQAVKHQLADVHLWHEIAALSADATWEAPGAHSAALAKAAAIRATAAARAACQQLLGGMGFTWEHDFHRYLRRALTLEPLLGSADDLHTELGAALRAGAISDALVAL
jgi:hypothetical protein